MSKGFWVLMGWHWNNGKAALRTPESSAYDLRLSEGYNTDDLIAVPRLSPYTTYRTLGFPIPSMSLTEVQCSAILSPALNTVLPKLHMNQHTAHCVHFTVCGSIITICRPFTFPR